MASPCHFYTCLRLHMALFDKVKVFWDTQRIHGKNVLYIYIYPLARPRKSWKIVTAQ